MENQDIKYGYYMYLFSFPVYLIAANAMVHFSGKLGAGTFALFIFTIANIPLFVSYRKRYFRLR